MIGKQFFPLQKPQLCNHTIIIPFPTFMQDSKVGNGRFGCHQNAANDDHYRTFPKDILWLFNQSKTACQHNLGYLL